MNAFQRCTRMLFSLVIAGELILQVGSSTTRVAAVPPGYPNFVSASCDSPVAAGAEFWCRVEVSPYTLALDLTVLVAPSNLDVIPWAGQTHAIFFDDLATVVNFTITSAAVPDDAVVTMTFSMLEAVTDNVVDTISADIQFIGTHNPPPPPTATIPPTTPTATPAPTVANLRPQTGTISGRDMRLAACLNNKAGGEIALQSDNPAVISVPASVLVPVGSTCAHPVVHANDVSGLTIVTFTASTATGSISASTRVHSRRPWISTQRVSRAGGQSRITVCLTNVALTGGLDIPLSSSDQSTFPVPETLHIEPARACGSLVVAVGTVAEPTTVTVTAQTPDGPRSSNTVVQVIEVAGSAEDFETPVSFPTPLDVATPIAT